MRHFILVVVASVAAAFAATFVGEPPPLGPGSELSLGDYDYGEDYVPPLSEHHDHVPPGVYDSSALLRITDPRSTDFPDTVKPFGVDCILCQGYTDCANQGNPHYCNGSVTCETIYTNARLDVPIQRGCGFRPNDSLVWEKNRGPVYCQPIAVPPGAQACSCRAAPSDIKKMHPNYTKGGMPLCNKDPVRLNMKQPWEEIVCVACANADNCATSPILVQCGAETDATFVATGCMAEFMDSQMTIPTMMNCADLPANKYVNNECRFHNVSGRYRCYCKGPVCNRLSYEDHSSTSNVLKSLTCLMTIVLAVLVVMYP
jgi:hypothetical protein